MGTIPENSTAPGYRDSYRIAIENGLSPAHKHYKSEPCTTHVNSLFLDDTALTVFSTRYTRLSQPLQRPSCVAPLVPTTPCTDEAPVMPCIPDLYVQSPSLKPASHFFNAALTTLITVLPKDLKYNPTFNLPGPFTIAPILGVTVEEPCKYKDDPNRAYLEGMGDAKRCRWITVMIGVELGGEISTTVPVATAISAGAGAGFHGQVIITRMCPHRFGMDSQQTDYEDNYRGNMDGVQFTLPTLKVLTNPKRQQIPMGSIFEITGECRLYGHATITAGTAAGLFSYEANAGFTAKSSLDINTRARISVEILTKQRIQFANKVPTTATNEEKPVVLESDIPSQAAPKDDINELPMPPMKERAPNGTCYFPRVRIRVGKAVTSSITGEISAGAGITLPGDGHVAEFLPGVLESIADKLKTPVTKLFEKFAQAKAYATCNAQAQSADDYVYDFTLGLNEKADKAYSNALRGDIRAAQELAELAIRQDVITGVVGIQHHAIGTSANIEAAITMLGFDLAGFSDKIARRRGEITDRNGKKIAYRVAAKTTRVWAIGKRDDRLNWETSIVRTKDAFFPYLDIAVDSKDSRTWPSEARSWVELAVLGGDYKAKEYLIRNDTVIDALGDVRGAKSFFKSDDDTRRLGTFRLLPIGVQRLAHASTEQCISLYLQSASMIYADEFGGLNALIANNPDPILGNTTPREAAKEYLLSKNLFPTLKRRLSRRLWGTQNDPHRENIKTYFRNFGLDPESLDHYLALLPKAEHFAQVVAELRRYYNLGNIDESNALTRARNISNALMKLRESPGGYDLNLTLATLMLIAKNDGVLITNMQLTGKKIPDYIFTEGDPEKIIPDAACLLNEKPSENVEKAMRAVAEGQKLFLCKEKPQSEAKPKPKLSTPRRTNSEELLLVTYV